MSIAVILVAGSAGVPAAAPGFKPLFGSADFGGGGRVGGPEALYPINVSRPFFNELHYDNMGTDVDEGVEIAGPAGIDLDGMTLNFINGRADGCPSKNPCEKVYMSEKLTGCAPSDCHSRPR